MFEPDDIHTIFPELEPLAAWCALYGAVMMAALHIPAAMMAASPRLSSPAGYEKDSIA
jgi:hypothetical protein